MSSSSNPRSASLEISRRKLSFVVSKQVGPFTNTRERQRYKAAAYIFFLTSLFLWKFSNKLRGNPDEELVNLMERLAMAEGDRDRARDELEEMKKVANEANLRLTDAEPSDGKVADVSLELDSVVEALSKSNEDLKIKEIVIEVLKAELGKVKGLEMKLKERDASLGKLVEDLRNAKSSEAHTLELLSESKKRIQELEAEVEKGKESGMKMLNSFVEKTKHLEETKILLQESKVEIASLREKVETLDDSHGQKRDEDGSFRSGLQLAKENFARVQENERDSALKAKNLLKEIELLKNELKLASEAEENSKKAMDDLALALKEVAAEANQTKEKLVLTQKEVEYFKRAAEESKEKLKIFPDRRKSLLDEARKEADQHRHTAERLRFEAEESLQAWNLKETEFVSCIKRTEEEKAIALEENNKLLESLEEYENMNKTAKQENQKLRDILKQAINEANVAKEAAGIARQENSQLKDILTEKDDALVFISRENESLRINEAAALEKINELKRLLSEASGKEVIGENGKDHELKQRPPTPTDHKEPKHGRKLSQTFSLNLKEIIVHNKHKESSEDQKVVPDKPKGNDDDSEDEGSDNSDPLKGSIFDVADSPVSEARLQKKAASCMRGFRWRSFHRKEPSIGGEAQKRETPNGE